MDFFRSCIACCCRPAENKQGEAVARGGIVTLDLRRALRDFRISGSELLQKSPDASREPLWEAACDMVDALLMGVLDHLPHVQAHCEVDVQSVGGAGNGTSLTVRFTPSPIVGEAATASRYCQEVFLSDEMRFTLEDRPSERPNVILRVHGIIFKELPGMSKMRQKIKDATGANFNKKTAYDWWLKNKHIEFPLELSSSKFHRVFDSLFGTPVGKMLPANVPIDFFYGFLLGTNTYVDYFVFHHDDKGSKIRVHAKRGVNPNPDEEKLIAFSQRINEDTLRVNRNNAERFAPSSGNWGAMFYGLNIGQPAADARIITKLFSAARWRGPGKSGWQQLDETWLCRDRRNSLGMVVEEQGRLIWRVLDSASPSPSPKVSHRPSPRRLWSCCRRKKLSPYGIHAPAAHS